MTVSRVVAPFAACASFSVAAATVVLGVMADRSSLVGGDPALQSAILFAAVAAPVLVGLILALRGAAPAVAWVLLLGAFAVCVAAAAQPYAEVALLVHPGMLPAGRWAAAASDATWPLLFAWPLALAFVFPDGRLVSRAWRPVAFTAAGAIALLIAVIMLTERRLGAPFAAFENPTPPALAGLSVLRFRSCSCCSQPSLPAPLGLGARPPSAGHRAFAVALVRLGRIAHSDRLRLLSVVGPTRRSCGRSRDLVVLTLEAAAAVAVGVAVTRYRLYELGRLINRTLVYGLLSFLLGAVYVGIAFQLGVLAERCSSRYEDRRRRVTRSVADSSVTSMTVHSCA